MSMLNVGVRVPAGQLSQIEIAAAKGGQTASQWMRDAALNRLNEAADGERLAAVELRLATKIDERFAALDGRIDGSRDALKRLGDEVRGRAQ